MQPLKAFEDTVASWPRISVYSHRFGGVSSASQTQKSVMCMTEGSSTFHSAYHSRCAPNGRAC